MKKHLFLKSLLIAIGLLVTSFTTQVWAGSATATTVYYAISVGDLNCYTVKLNVNFKGDGDDWHTYTMEKTGYTYGGKLVYSASYTDAYGGVGCMQFQLYDGGTHKSQQQPYSSWTDVSTYNGKVYVHNTGWNTASWDNSYKVYFARTSSWDHGTPYVYAWNSSCDYNAGWPGQTMSEVTGQTYDGKKIYYKEVNKRYTSVKFSNNGSNQTADMTLYSTNANKMYYYDGSADRWVTLQYDIDFDEEGATSSGSYPSKALVGSTMPTITTAPSKTGYDFGGYYDGDNGTGTKYWNADRTGARTCAIDGPNQFYAKWTAKTTTVTLTKNAPAGETVSGGTSVTATYDSALPSFTAQTCTGGYALTGYWTAATGDATKVINADGTFNGNSGIWNRTDGATLTLYARWSLDRTLTYDGNTNTSGNVPAAATTYANGTEVTVLGNVAGSPLVKTGYSFTGWNTAPGGGGTAYSAGSTITMNANYTLYAQWSENLSTVSVVASPTGAGTFSSTSVSAGVDTKPTVTATAQPGYKFGSWGISGGATMSGSTDNPVTITGKGAGADATLTATFNRTYAYVEGRFQVYNAARSALTNTSLENGGWNENQCYIPFTYDGTNHRFYLHTYSTPKELSANIQSNAPVFYIKTSTVDGSLSGVVSSYWSASAQTLSAANTKKTLTHTGDLVNYNLKFSSSDETGYAVIYFDEAGIWYEFEQRLLYNGNGNTGGSAPSNNGNYFAKGTKAAAGTNAYTKTGYHFIGWKVNNAGDLISAGSNVTMNSNITLYAQWEADTYEDVTIDDNGGSADGAYTVTYHATSLEVTTVPTRTGYTVKGYYKEAGTTNKVANTDGTLNANKTYTDGSSRWISTASPTLYAGWTAKTYTADNNLDKNGGDSHGKYTATYDATSIAINTTPLKSGYHVDGYYKEAGLTNLIASSAGALEASTAYTDASSHWTNDGNVTLYTKWTANTWYVRFNANGGSGSMSNESFTYDASAKALTSNTFTKTGYDFAGWATSAEGSVVYTDGQKVSNLTNTKDGIVDLYAKWTAKKYTITLDNQCAYSPGTHYDGSATEFEATYGSPYFTNNMKDAPSSYSYEFGGYYSAVGGGGDQIITYLGALSSGTTVYTDGSGNWNYDGEPTVYAKWSISLSTGLSNGIHANGGSGGAITLTYNSSSTSGFTPSIREGYILAGYYTAATDGDKVINANGTIVAEDVEDWTDDGKWVYCGSDLDIYAHWTPITYTIAFDKNDDASFLNSDVGDDPDDIAATYGVLATMPANPYTRTGYTFNGWATEAHKAKGSVPVTDYDYQAGYSYMNLTSTQGATVTLYPKWTGNLYTVSLNARGGICAVTSIDVRYGEKYGSGYGGLLPTPLAPSGKEFIGWYTSPSGGTLVTKDTQMSTIGAHTLYARYSDIAMVYFKNTIGWSEVYVTYDAYWDNTNGTGNNGKIYHKMSKVAGTDDIYYDQIPGSCLSTWKYFIAFNSKELLNEGKHAPQDAGNYGNYNSGEVVFRKDFDSIASMFVPKDVNTNDVDGNYQKNSAQYISTGYHKNNGASDEDPGYISGYWRTYNNVFAGYILKYANHGVDSWSSDKKLIASSTSDSTFSYTLTLAANTSYDYAIYKQYKHNGKSDQWRTGSSAITSAACTNLKLICEPANGWITTTAAGEYTFKVTMKSDGHMYLTVEYPLAANDYRVLYSWNDGSAHEYSSEYIKPIAADTIDTISVFVHKLESPVVSRSMKIQKCTGIAAGVPSWTDVEGGSITLSNENITKNGVYDFAFKQYESSTPTGEFIEKYEGDYYIRTQAADGGWDQYLTNEDNVMTYSAYSMTQTVSDPYSHYYCRFIGSTTTDIKFAIATKYSPNISGTMVGDDIIGDANTNTLPAYANVRFSWNEETNALKRAYIKPAQGAGNSRFLVMHGAANDMIFNPNGSAIGASGDLLANELQFEDKGDWLYQVMLQAKPGALVSIMAKYNNENRYLVGGASSYEKIMGGTGTEKYTIMALYDFKTNRLMNAWTPGGDITERLDTVDMLWIRYKQNSAQQVTFNGGSLSNVTAVGAIQLDYDDLVGHVASWTYATRPLLRYFIAFPFNVNVSDIFGLHGAELGREFVIRKYNGAERAKNGLYSGDGDTYWVDLTMDSVMHANEGYSLVFDNEYLNGDLGTIWTNKGGGSSVYLYFPAAAKIASISDANKSTTLVQHVCQDTTTFTYKESKVSHANSDSHWNLIGSPLFVDSYVYSSSGTNGQEGAAERTTLDSYYAYNVTYNYWEPEAYYSGGEYYACQAMHAMLVQFAGSVTWSKSAPTPPAGIVARERKEAKVTNQLITLNLLQEGENGDHTYIKMDENGNADFMLCEDMFKIDNKKIPNIFSYASGNPVAYNKVPVESQTINLGVEIRKNGTYMFEMPENVDGQITLVDNFAQTRTNLNLEDYEVYLEKGNYYDRFQIEIDIKKVPTAIDGVEDGSGTLKDGKAHKYLENDKMYILQNGVIFDAQGKRVK